MVGLAPDAVRRRIEASIERMRPLSPTMTKVMSLVNDIDASPSDLLQVIKLDPVLTTRVLRLINSAHFGLEQPISSLNRALIILGMNTVKNLALSGAAMDILSQQRSDDAYSHQLWNHSIWVGVVSRNIVRVRRGARDDQEMAFISGLLHDLGEICILRVFPREFTELRRSIEDGLAQVEAERALFGGTHTEFGGVLGRRWGFPEAIVAVMESHHDPIVRGPNAVLSCAAYLANELWWRRTVGPNDVDPLRQDVLTAIQLDVRDLSDALKSADNEVAAARAFLET